MATERKGTTRKLIDVKNKTLMILDRYATLKQTKSKPLIEGYLEDLSFQILRKHPNILSEKKVSDKFKAKLA